MQQDSTITIESPVGAHDRMPEQDGAVERLAALQQRVAALEAEVGHLRDMSRRQQTRLWALRLAFDRVVQASEFAAECRQASDDMLRQRGLPDRAIQIFRQYLSPLQNFSWVVPRQVAGSALLDGPEDVAALAQQGIRTVITLTEVALPAQWLTAAGVRGVHVPMQDLEAPLDRVVDAVATIEASLAAGAPVLVHCMGGIGRTGTVLAAFFVRRGAEPAAAIAEIRRLRPMSIESPAQEAAVYAFAEMVRRWSVDGSPVAPPEAS